MFGFFVMCIHNLLLRVVFSFSYCLVVMTTCNKMYDDDDGDDDE